MFLKGQTQGARGEGWGHDVGWGARSHVVVVQPVVELSGNAILRAFDMREQFLGRSGEKSFRQRLLLILRPWCVSRDGDSKEVEIGRAHV